MKKLLITAEQVINLRNNMIISEALEEEYKTVGSDIGTMDLPNVNREPGDPAPTSTETKDSAIYGAITSTLLNYVQTYGLSAKIADEIHKRYPQIDSASSRDFITQFFRALDKMAKDPAQNTAFERYLHSIGVTIPPELLRLGVK